MSNLFDATSKEILLDIFRQSILHEGRIDAISYRADHEDWLDRLTDLESRQCLKREGDNYRVTFLVLTAIDDPDVKIQLDRCESVFNLLREHYKNAETRHREKLLKNLADDLGLNFSQTVQTIRYFMDESALWCSGGATDLEDMETSYVKPGESIITIKKFSDLVAKVQGWYEQRIKPVPASSVINSLLGWEMPAPKTVSELHPCPVVTSFLYQLGSDKVVKIVGRVGCAVDWTISEKEAYSHQTRLRAYIPRIEAALNALSSEERLLVTRNFAREVLGEKPEWAEPLNAALAKIGWKIVEGELATESINVREVFFPSGSEHTAYVELKVILQRATRQIDIVDPYLDGTIFTMLKTLPKSGIHVRLLTARPPNDFKLEADKLRKEMPTLQLEIRTTRGFHDRFIVLDSTLCFHIGASIKDAGKQACMISQLEDAYNVNSLLAYTQQQWGEAEQL